jgi:hypothetical protein
VKLNIGLMVNVEVWFISKESMRWVERTEVK